MIFGGNILKYIPENQLTTFSAGFEHFIMFRMFSPVVEFVSEKKCDFADLQSIYTATPLYYIRFQLAHSALRHNWQADSHTFW